MSHQLESIVYEMLNSLLSTLCYVLFDSGSQKTIISVKAVKRLRLEPERNEELGIKTFGRKDADMAVRRVFKCSLSPLFVGNPVEVEAFEVDQISNVANIHVEHIKHNFAHLTNVFFSDVSRNEEILEIDILCGSNFVWSFQDGERIQGGPGEPIAVNCRNGNHNEIILSCFKEFLKSSLESSSAFKYRSRLFTHFALLLELFEFSTHHNFGLGRETCYILQLPVYAHLGFRNYYTETFIHVVNFLAKWLLAFRKMLQNNSSINLSGKSGEGIEHDSWVEGCIVKPIKQSVSGHTTIKTCLQIAGSVDIIHSAREAYRGRESFDEHSTSHHSIPSPLPDQLKGAWYCISRKLISNTSKQDPIFCRFIWKQNCGAKISHGC
eukprot:Seg5125.3 transcript_id=Seg5125.3/GoldUCD/mRNA.D3Y31 product="hypothetical protein" protein_id=Seg5125.3/GoldUCD/D3Y31